MIRFILAAAALVEFAATGFAADCPAPERAPRVEIGIDEGNVAYDFTLTRAELVDLPRMAGASAPNHGGAPQGLTLSSFDARIEAESRANDVAPGLRCVYAARVSVHITVDQHVYVDRRYPEGSCERRAIIEHEQGHVRINRAAAHEVEGTLRATVSDYLARHPFVRSAPKQSLQQAYLEPIRDRIKPILDRIRTIAGVHHAELDAPASYAMTRARCRHW